MKQILTFFDYVYYRVCTFYNNSGEKRSSITGLFIISLFYFFNLISVAGFAIIIFKIDLPAINKSAFLIVNICIVILNGIRYNKLKYDVLNERWGNEDEITNEKKGFAVAL